MADIASQINIYPKGMISHGFVVQHPINIGSVTQASTGYVGSCDEEEVSVLLKEMVPMFFFYGGMVRGGLGMNALLTTCLLERSSNWWIRCASRFATSMPPTSWVRICTERFAEPRE